MQIDTSPMQRAQQVLTALKKKLTAVKPKYESYLILGAFANGREQGYCLTLLVAREGKKPDFWYRWHFSEYRSSDSIVVYQGPGMVYNEMTDEEWKNRQYYLCADAAAQDIVSDIRDYVVKGQHLRPEHGG